MQQDRFRALVLDQEDGATRAVLKEVPRDALCSQNTAAQEHANVAGGSEQTDGTQGKVHTSGDAIF